MAKFREKGRQEIENYLEQATDESAFVGELIKKTFEEDALFISNSMPIRDIDNLLLNKNIDIYANRGANGIDGIVSTALGMAVHKRITLLIGDLSFYHDMNGLLMSKLNNIQMNIVLLNNDGGGIFHITTKESATDYFERLFGTDGIDFEYTAKLYQFDFKRFNSVSEFKMPHCYLKLRRFMN